jgi:hypothetical protein
MQASDAKLNGKARLKAITVLRSHLFVTRSNSEEQKRHIEHYKGEVDKMVLERGQLIAELKTLQLQGAHAVSRTKAKLLRVSQEQKTKAISIAKDALWRVRKFISCSDEEEWCAAFVLKRMGLPNMEEESDDHWSWVATYKKVIKKKLFERRNYVTSEMKKACSVDFLDKGLKIPTLAMILKCATRTIDPDNAEEMKVLMWYWETLLPKMVGKSNWGDDKMYYSTVSLARTDEIKPKRLITYASEAMICAIWDNNYEKWPKLHVWALKEENKDSVQPNWNGKYTVTDGGQNEWGGWKPEGLEAYNSYVKQVKAGRQSQNCPQLEKITLQQLRLRAGIDQPNHQQTLTRKRMQQRHAKLNSQKPLPDRASRLVRTDLGDDEDDEVTDYEPSGSDDDEEDSHIRKKHTI